MSGRSDGSESNSLSFDPETSVIPSIVHTAKAGAQGAKFTFHNKRMTVQPASLASIASSLHATLPQLGKAEVL